MGHCLRRARSVFRHPAARGWLITAALTLLIRGMNEVVDHNLLHAKSSGHWDLEFLVLAGGMLVLNRLQELCLCLYYLWMHYISHGHFVQANNDPNFQGQLIRRGLTLACFVWAVHLRTKLMASNTNLSHLQERTEQKLALGLQASALAHELRQPLGHLLLQVQLLQFRLEQTESVDPALETPLDEVRKSGRQINSLITTMTKLLRPPSATPSGVNLCAVVEHSLWELRQVITDARVAVECHGLRRPVWIQGDAEVLQIACKNLLHNALAVLQEVPQLQRRLRIQLDCGPETIELIVADSGPGLPAREPRELLMNSASRNGMGLGLLTVQAIARRHQGRLSLGRSTDLGGAEVRLSFPAVVTSSAGSDRAPRGAPAQHR